MAQHQQLGLGIHAGTSCSPAQPGVADLAGIGCAAAMPRMPHRPRPILQQKETSRTHDHTVFGTDRRKRHCCARVAPLDRRLYVRLSVCPALRHWTPLIEHRIARRGGSQPICVMESERFQSDVCTLQRYRSMVMAPTMQRARQNRNVGTALLIRGRIQGLDCRHFAVRDAEAQPLGVALGCRPALRHDHGVLASRLTRSRQTRA